MNVGPSPFHVTMPVWVHVFFLVIATLKKYIYKYILMTTTHVERL